MALDVVDVRDRVVHHQTQRENQGEQGHPVDRVSEQVIHEQGQGEADRHGQGDHQCLAPPQRQGQQNHHADNGKGQRAEQLIDLLLGGRTGVAGHLDIDVVGQHLPFQLVELQEYAIGHGHGVGTPFLGQRQGYGRVGQGRLGQPVRLPIIVGVADARIGVGLAGSVDYLGDILEIYRAAGVNANDHVAHLACGSDKGVGRDGNAPVGP